MSEGAFSSSDTQDIDYQDQTMDELSVPHSFPPSSQISDITEEHEAQRVAHRAESEPPEEHCKEVQCIETNKLRSRRSQEFFQTPEKKTHTDDQKHSESMSNSAENAIKLYACDFEPSFDLEKPETEESLALKRCVVSSRDSALTRSRSCRASFMVIPNSWFDDSASTTPSSETFRYSTRRPEKVRKSLSPDEIADKSTGNAEEDKSTCNAEEETAVNDIGCVTEVKQKTEMNHAPQSSEQHQVQ